MSYKIEWNDKSVYIIYDGDLNINDLFQVNGKVINDYRYISLNSVTSDFLSARSIYLSKSDIIKISTLDEIPSIMNPNLKFSVVSNNSDIQEMVFLYMDLMKANEWKIRLFDNLEDSIEWCNKK